MSNTVISVEHLSKKYRLGIINNGALFRDIQTWIALKTGREDPHSKIGEEKYSNTEDHFWALKDVSFTVEQGARIGIIGKNGAGKSTLLRLLSRITAPTEGSIKIKGRIASLLEVGTGFHKELTGRENIYLNGAILGMKTRRINRKLDEIIAFSGIEHHIDTPVKRYSSGMFVRLAFAVAAHLDSDILIADEVLAVGDAEFQKKALGKMQDLSAGQGRTVLFVSHNMAAVKSLCERGILLEKGKIKCNDKIDDLIAEYTKPDQAVEFVSERVYVVDTNKPFQLEKIEITDKNGNHLPVYEAQQELIIRLYCISITPVPNLYGHFLLKKNSGEELLSCFSIEDTKDVFNNMSSGKYIVELRIPPGLLSPGEYIPALGFASDNFTGSVIGQYHNIFKFKITDSITLYGNNRSSITSMVLDWNIV
jgi:lipopolysaccharide transport system ATP-binding protein